MTWSEFYGNITDAFKNGYNPVTDSFSTISGWFTNPGQVAVNTTETAETGVSTTLGNVMTCAAKMVSPIFIPLSIVTVLFFAYLWLSRRK
jgi:hypothetical protein